MLIWRKFVFVGRRPFLWWLLGRDVWMEHHHFLVARYPREEGHLYIVKMKWFGGTRTFMYPAKYNGDVACALRRLRKEVVLSYTATNTNEKTVIRCELPDWAVASVRRLVIETEHAPPMQERA